MKAVDSLIREAMDRGEFDDLPSKGKRLDLTTYFDTPEELRLAYTILKDANILPEEAELLKEIATLKEKLDFTTHPVQRKQIRSEIDKRLLKFNILMDRRKS